MNATIQYFSEYNSRRWSLPWVAIYNPENNKYGFPELAGFYTGKAGQAGELVVTDVKQGVVYAYGRKDKSGKNSMNEKAIWDGTQFVPWTYGQPLFVHKLTPEESAAVNAIFMLTGNIVKASDITLLESTLEDGKATYVMYEHQGVQYQSRWVKNTLVDAYEWVSNIYEPNPVAEPKKKAPAKAKKATAKKKARVLEDGAEIDVVLVAFSGMPIKEYKAVYNGAADSLTIVTDYRGVIEFDSKTLVQANAAKPQFANKLVLK